MKITIENIKRVNRLQFELPGQGVWILTGLNGGGKTTLLAAIYRMRAQHAFQKYYKTSLGSVRLDSYAQAKVTYELDNQQVSYKYSSHGWRPTPRANASLLNNCPYPSIIYIDASADRVEPYADEIIPRRIRAADNQICDFLHHVLNDAKWTDLKYVNTRRGVGSEAYFIQYRNQNTNHYFSEKSFSLGELCAFKLAKEIYSAPDNSLLLIDEIEMALHPQAQVRLVEKIRSIAEAKNLTVIFSTHSASIIKSASRKNLIYLKENYDRSVEIIKNAYPAQILGDVAFDDELTADFLFFVEDKQAKLLLEQAIAHYFAVQGAARSFQPLYKVVPVGGFIQVVEMLLSSSFIFPRHVKRFAFLDEDVQSETLTQARRENNRHILDLFNNATDNIKYLPCTPENGVIEMIEDSANASVINQLNTAFDGATLNIGRIIRSVEYQLFNSQNVRDRSKKRMTHLVDKIKAQTGVEKVQIRKIFYKSYVTHRYGASTGPLRSLFGPIFYSR